MAASGLRGAVAVLVVTLVFGGSSGQTVRAQEESIDQRLRRLAGIEPVVAREAFMALRRGLANGNKADVCGLVTYPLKQPKGDVASAEIGRAHV